MTITITPETETLLRQKAEREGQDVDVVADALLAAVLASEAQERAETIAEIQRGFEAGAAGRVRSAADVFADMRAQLAQAIGSSGRQ